MAKARAGPGYPLCLRLASRNAEGRDEGRKDRPCAIVLAAPIADGETRVYVLPVTHAAPRDPTLAIELPAPVKRRLGLDDQPSWIVLDEINDFLWPGYDLRPIPGSMPATIEYGHLPPRLFDTVRTAFLALARARRVRRVPRSRRRADPPEAIEARPAHLASDSLPH